MLRSLVGSEMCIRDRIITGRVYNGINRPPFALGGAENGANKTRRGGATQTVGGGGFNEMSMDDTPGEEQIRINAQYDHNTSVGNDQSLSVGNDRDVAITNNETKTVGVDQALTVDSNRTVTVNANHMETIGAAQTVTLRLIKLIRSVLPNAITFRRTSRIRSGRPSRIKLVWPAIRPLGQLPTKWLALQKPSTLALR